MTEFMFFQAPDNPSEGFEFTRQDNPQPEGGFNF
jgi:hypothetical protein